MRQLEKPPVMVPPESHTANLNQAKYCLCFDSVFLLYRHTRRNKGRQILDKKKRAVQYAKTITVGPPCWSTRKLHFPQAPRLDFVLLTLGTVRCGSRFDFQDDFEPWRQEPLTWLVDGGQRYWTRNEDHGKDGEGSRAFAKKSYAQTERNQLGDGGSNGASTSHEVRKEGVCTSIFCLTNGLGGSWQRQIVQSGWAWRSSRKPKGANHLPNDMAWGWAGDGMSHRQHVLCKQDKAMRQREKKKKQAGQHTQQWAHLEFGSFSFSGWHHITASPRGGVA